MVADEKERPVGGYVLRALDIETADGSPEHPSEELGEAVQAVRLSPQWLVTRGWNSTISPRPSSR